MEIPFFKALEDNSIGQSAPLDDVLANIQFDAQGLVPTIAQQYDTGEVLMMAWMNEESLRETLANKRVCYWSRSRQQLWRKGESSGHHQKLIEMRLDCDGDTVLCLVDQTGPACHTNRKNCFYLSIQDDEVKTIL